MKHRRIRGFTLLEVLVVLIIIGILVSMVALSMNRPHGDELRTEAQRLQALLGFAAQEALLQGKEYGVFFSPQGYEFRQLTAAGWRGVEGDAQLRARQLPGDMRLRLTLDGVVVDLRTQQQDVQVFLLSSGEMTPFELHLETPEEGAVTLQGSITGQFQVADART